MRFLSFLTLTFLVGTFATHAQRGLKDIPTPDPVAEQAQFRLADGFEINLFAADPMIAKPIQMNWDERGRLWVCSSSIYPHIEPGKTETDQIIILEDTDRDGTADKRTAFAGGLLIPTAILPGDGGAYVANSTEVLHLADTTGDGRADKQRVLLSGFGTEDTHHILHTFRWGPAGGLFMCQSIYIHSHIETPFGPKRLLAGGVWRYEPHTGKLDVYNRGLINSWGLCFDDYGQSFQTDGAGGEGINYTFPGSTHRTARGAKRLIKGLNPGQPKLCGLEILSGRAIPNAWKGRHITADFRGNRIVSFELQPNGSTYTSTRKETLVESPSIAFRPIDISQGPDGAIYIADWYNPIIQHGEVDFRDERRDHKHGRIWRITHKEHPVLPYPDFKNPADLFDAPERWTRDQARRVNRERVRKNPNGERGSVRIEIQPPSPDPNQRLEMLWQTDATSQINNRMIEELLAQDDPQIRAASIRVLRRHVDPRHQATLQSLIRDPHPQVRLETLHALRNLPASAGAEATQTALLALDFEMDDPLDFSLEQTVRHFAPQWTEAIQKDPNFFGDPAKLVYALRATKNPAALDSLVALLRDDKLPPEQANTVLQLIGEIGNQAQLTPVFQQALKAPSAKRLTALQSAARRLKPKGNLADIQTLFDDPKHGPAAMNLAAAWKLEVLRPRLEAAKNFDAIATLGGQKANQFLQGHIRSDVDVPSRIRATRALVTVQPGAAANLTAELLQTVPSHQLDPILQPLLANKRGPALLTQSLKNKTIPSAAAAHLQRFATRVGRSTKPLADALQTAGNLKPITTALSGDDLATFVADIAKHGNANRGEAIYRRPQLLCMTCHAIGGGGGIIGPDMTSIGASAPTDYLLESLLNPNAKIKEGYHLTSINKTDGTVLTGVIARESDTDLVLRDPAGNEQTLAKNQIASREMLPVSLMPAGLTASLRRDELIDLVAFMDKLGETGGLNPPTAAHVRNWEQLAATKESNDAVRHHDLAHATSDDPRFQWLPTSARVDGTLAYPDINKNRFAINAQPYFVLRFQHDQARDGDLILRPNNPAGLTLFHGKKPAALDKPIALKNGQNTFTLAINERDRKGVPIRLDLVSP